MVVLDPDRPYAQLSEREPARIGPDDSLEMVDISTVFLTASRCPVNCTMCDLHRFTHDAPTEPGSIGRQIDYAQTQLPASRWVKLYNSGNFFDPASIPPQDYGPIAQRCDRYERVIVENHPRFGRNRHHVFRDLLDGRLEIAVGLETVQPRMLGRIGKQMSRDDFDCYATFLKKSNIDLRVFLIVGAPGISTREAVRWARLSIRHALQQSARHISLIPARPGNGWDATAKTLPAIGPDVLADLLRLGLKDVDGRCCLSVDLWDIASQASTVEEQELIDRIERSVMTQDMSQL